ncbi:MAG: peptidase C11 [Oscillospiraceae bacterium]|nr:peptidase C11 [Oscillospiraceae bacterium]
MDNHSNRPRSREKNVTSGGSGVHKRGDGLNTGQVGAGGQGRPSSGGIGKKAAGGGGITLLAIIIALLFGGNFGTETTTEPSPASNTAENTPSISSTGSGGSQIPANFLSAASGSNYFASSGGAADTSVAEGSREKYTSIKGDNTDTVTLMVYMCGTDLESKYGMASSDLQEMANAKYGDNVRIIVYTGGCTGWKTKEISSTTNQIYQVINGGLQPLVMDNGAKPMTEPSTLSYFIQYCNSNFPSNRRALILWDHGGGSVSGYGYDEKYRSSGSMSLSGIRQALSNGGVKFDFIGFDACLMATAETALMLNDYADYLIASEETEPGIGWYYTNWLNTLGKNTSLPTVEIGKTIVDDFVSKCAEKCQGQKTTLSVIDLAEFSNTIPENLTAFSKSISMKIKNQEYQDVSQARYTTREFAQSSKIDQIDLVNFAENMNTPEGRNLSEAIKKAVKYNRTSSNMSNAYGVSIYFPYKRTSYVDKACSTYTDIGMDSEYSDCIREFAKLETSGQISAGGTGSPVSSLLDLGSSVLSNGGAAMLGSLLTSFVASPSGSGRSIDGLDENNISFMTENPLSDSQAANYISMNYFDASNLVWNQDAAGNYTMALPDSQWSMIHQVDLNMFYDDGMGYVDLGLDNLYSFDENGNFVADTDRTWLSINGQPVAYYHTDTVENGDEYTITGYVPAMLNGERVNLILVFDNETPSGYIAGASTNYVTNETDTVPKSLTEVKNGDKLDFLCDYYSYNGNYQNSYYLGDTVTVSKNLEISNTDVGTGEVRIMYRFTDMYHQEYWTPAIIN